MKLSTVGLDALPDFPAAPYEACHAHVLAHRFKHPVWQEFAGAWNAVAYRFQAMADAGDAFAASLAAHGAHPQPKERFDQETALSNFYDKGFEAFESAFYGLFALGAMVTNTPLALSSPKDKQTVNPSNVRAAFAKTFPGEASIAIMDTVLNDVEFKSFRATRAILSHRTAPGRTMFVGIPSADEIPTEWKLNNMPLDQTIATTGRAEVSRLLTALVTLCDDFSRRQL